MNPRYPQLTTAQRLRKQRIRNWKKDQAEILKYIDFANKCSILQRQIEERINKKNIDDQFKSTQIHLSRTINSIFKYHDEQDNYLYQTDLMINNIVEHLYDKDLDF